MATMPRLPRRPRSAHKGMFGHLLIIGGESVAFLLSPEASPHRHHRTWP